MENDEVRSCLCDLVLMRAEYDARFSFNNYFVMILFFIFSCTFSFDSRLRCDAADVYFTLYGRTRPSCLPIPDVSN